MSNNNRKTTNSKTKTTKSTRATTTKKSAKPTVKSAKVTRKSPNTITAKQAQAHKKHLARASGILLVLGAISFVVFFILFWIFFHTCDLTQPGILSALEIIFILPLLVNILSLICALDCKHPLHSKTVILNIVTIAIETVFIVFIPLYLLILQ